MANKRKAQDAFGKAKTRRKEESLFSSDGVSKPQLSAFAAARQATQPQEVQGIMSGDEQDMVEVMANAPYDGHRSGTTTLSALSGQDAAQLPPSTPRPSIRLSNFSKRNGNVLQDDPEAFVLSLKSDESITIVGEYDLQVVKGVITLYGAMLHPERGVQRVYAPSTSALPVIIARKDNSAIRLTSVKSALRKLEKLSPLFRNIGAKDDLHKRSFALLSRSDDDLLQRSLSPLEVDDETKKVLSRINARLESSQAPARIMAVGPKSAGKSTFNRLLCNMIISRPGSYRCLYLDLDPGQPEFGPAGQLSLVEVSVPVLGPPFTHIASRDSPTYHLLRSHSIAATSFKDDPEHYVACAADLFRRAPKELPLLVNSCGWVTGLGANTLLNIGSVTKMTDIVILNPLESSLVDDLSIIAPNVHHIPRRQRQPSSRTPAESRAMQTLAYFHNKLGSNPPVWSSKPICNAAPYEVSFQAKAEGITAIICYGQAPNPNFLAEVLDGSIVAIVVLESDTLLDPSSIQRTPREDLPYLSPNTSGHTPPLDPSQSHCIGLSLIRGIDAESKTLHLITPLPETGMAALQKEKVVLVHGSFDAPEWAYLEDLHARGEAGTGEERPWVSTRKEQVGIEGSVWRLRHPPMAKDVR